MGFLWLTGWQMALLTLNVFLLLGMLFQKKILLSVAALGMLIALISALLSDLSFLSGVFYGVAVLLLISGLVETRWKLQPRNRILRILKGTLGVLGIALQLLLVSQAGVLRHPPVQNFSSLSYPEAFLQLHQQLEQKYPFGDWKQIQWEHLKASFLPRFEQAQKNQDQTGFYLTLREYLQAFQDGHVRIQHENLLDGNPVFARLYGGGVGLSALQLDSKEVRISLVLPGSPAAKAGIQPGAELVRVNGKPALQAYQQVKFLLGSASSAFQQRESQGRMLLRGKVGEKVQLAFRNPSQSLKTVSLTFVQDGFASLKKTQPSLTQQDLQQSPIEHQVLQGKYAYLKIKFLLSSDASPDPEQEVSDVLASWNQQKISGLVLDLRDNPGGEDELAARISGHFLKSSTFYEQVSYFNLWTSSFLVNSSEVLKAEAAQPAFTRPMVVLINARTASSAEGIPLMLKNQPQVKVVGFSSTAGAFGVLTRPLRFNMPGGLQVQFPDGRSLDAQGNIQVEKGTGEGGIAPDLNIPLDLKAFQQKYVQGKDVELEAAVKLLQEGW
ncbi:hypothetical protein GCM10008938_50770 [Deinococcus roseus]|uniref:PDZ domain-containing protein n=2 Tax=Deinococcus roseus TaxID=392414 RepID=A0ABQ2DHQ0_9DEIO|nr:hypothetical protein GCM10008938_50770 [Deinococcus roseus]